MAENTPPPLTDADRWPWLADVAHWIADRRRAGEPGVVGCSALKRIYCDRMRGDNVVFVHLAGNKDTIERRLNARLNHYMPPTLLDSQINTLEPPGPDEDPIIVSSGQSSATEVASVVAALGQ